MRIGVEFHKGVVEGASVGKESAGEGAADSCATKVGANVHPFHFADARPEFIERTKSNTAGKNPCYPGKQKCATRRGVFSREIRDFCIEVLVFEAGGGNVGDALAVFEDELAGGGKIGA